MYFRITLLRSAIGLPTKTTGVLRALGLTNKVPVGRTGGKTTRGKRLRTVYHPVSPDIAGQIFAVKELVDVQEVETPLSKEEMRSLRKPDPGFVVESRAQETSSA